MLNFEQKLELLQSYPQLQRKDVSLGRVNFHYEESAYEKKIVAFHIHPNGNGYIYAGLLHNYETDDKGFVNIRDYSEEQLRTLLDETIKAMSYNHKAVELQEQEKAKASFKLATTTSTGGTWVDEDGHTLTLKYEDEMWCVYSGLNLDMAFESRSEAGDYLKDEGFKPQT